ncbi:MAG: Flp family type IVb pilin [Candidatus Dormibacteria bacterium]
MYTLTSIRDQIVGGLSRLLDSDEAGQGMVEYAFIIVLIALIVIVVIVIIGNQTRNMWSNISAGFGHH